MPSAADYAKTAGNMTMFALQIASVAPVPGLDTVLTVLEGIKSACSEGPVHKEKFKDIGRTVDQLRGPLEEHYNRKKNESLDETVDYILGELEKVEEDVKKWGSYSWLQAMFFRKIIGDGLKSHQAKLNDLRGQFTFHAAAVTARGTEDLNAQTVELRKMLRAMQEMSFRNDEDLRDESNTRITRIQFETRFRHFQDQLKEIENQIGRKGPPKLDVSELKIFRDIPATRSQDGSNTEVFQGSYLGTVRVAVKKLTDLAVDDKYVKRFNTDLKIWAKVERHEHIMKLIGWTELDKHFALVSDWQANGNLKSHCEWNRDADRLHLLAGAADGVKYLHSLTLDDQCVVHGNLKCSNIMVNDKLEAVIHDFQMSKVVFAMAKERSILNTHTRTSSGRWQAPEAAGIMTIRPHCDVWSFGMTMLEVFTLQRPFPEMLSDFQVRSSIERGLRPKRPQTDWVTDAVWALMQDCWKEPAERPLMEEVHRRLLEAEKDRAENPPTRRFDHPKHDPHAHVNRRHGDI